MRLRFLIITLIFIMSLKKALTYIATFALFMLPLLKVVCHLPTNSHDIFPRIGSHCFHLWTQPKCCLNLK